MPRPGRTPGAGGLPGRRPALVHGPVRGAEHGQGAVGLVPQHGRRSRAQQVPDLLGDHREHPLRWIAG
ncbi:hypothetical protein [Streptomyces dysideae]|uniref:Uncharacterized protein n=1 Tax=Streptomyces dysideae TaxID=909626 RepID=A0A117S2J5_9ACTN|nr:hypothetical protein AQJ91_02195 [Streptomyces dysideae]